MYKIKRLQHDTFVRSNLPYLPMLFEEVKAFMLHKLVKELPETLTYHSINHVKDVYESAERLAEEEGIPEYEIRLLLTAALFHDSGFTVSPKGHEGLGCQIARLHLPDFEYTEEEIMRICGMIMATMIPQTPTNLLEEIICDADLDYLGRSDFPRVGNLLFKELKDNNVVQTEEEWDLLQIKFLTQHHYFTASAIRTRGPVKEMYLNYLKSLVKKDKNEVE